MSTYLEPDWIDRFAELWEQLGPETKTSLIDLLPARLVVRGQAGP